MPELVGTGRIADDLYLLAHHDATGKPFLQSRALGVGLAGALLAEQLFAGVAWVQANQIHLKPIRGLPSDDLGRYVLGFLAAERERHHPVRDWLHWDSAYVIHCHGKYPLLTPVPPTDASGPRLTARRDRRAP
jgi:Golgi phosphoprotein 3 (GPP34)